LSGKRLKVESYKVERKREEEKRDDGTMGRRRKLEIRN